MPQREYGALLSAYTVAFAEQLLRRAAPLSASSEDDARLVRFLCIHPADVKTLCFCKILDTDDALLARISILCHCDIQPHSHPRKQAGVSGGRNL